MTNARRKRRDAGMRRAALGAGALAMIVAGTGAVQAQGAARNETIQTRPRPLYDPLGIRTGGFLLLPSLDITETYDSNIFLTPSNAKNDFITTISPAVALRSQWSNHALNLGAGADINHYADHGNEGVNDFFVKGDGRVDVSRNTRLFAAASYNGLHEARGNPNSPAASVDPVDYRLLLANAGFAHRLNRVEVRVTGDLASYSYGDAVNATTGAAIVQNTRDRDEYRVTGRVSYEIQPEYQAFLRASFNNRNYDKLLGGFNRSSDGYEVVVGTDIDFTGVVFGEVFAGYRSQDYDDPRLSTVNGVTAGGKVFWNVTRLTTITGSLTRSVEETTIGGASGFFSTFGSLQVDHELRRNVLLDAHLKAGVNSYEGINRDDDEYELGIGARYLINRFARAGLSYTYSRRNSDAAGSDYTDHQVALTARIQY